jgi:hypothetical protein
VKLSIQYTRHRDSITVDLGTYFDLNWTGDGRSKVLCDQSDDEELIEHQAPLSFSEEETSDDGLILLARLT